MARSLRPGCSRVYLSCMLSLCIMLTNVVSEAASHKSPRLQRSNAKRWKDLGERIRQEATSKAQQFLSNRGQDLGVPIVIDILTLGFSKDGAYKYDLKLSKLEETLQMTNNRYCPAIWETKSEASICYYITYNVINLSDYGQDMLELEHHLKEDMTLVRGAEEHHDEHGHAHSTDTPVYEVDSADVEHWFEAAFHAVYGVEDETGSKHWHKHNAIFLINPSKLRMSPLLPNNSLPLEDLDPLEEWQRGQLDFDRLSRQDGEYRYHYKSYGSSAASSTWVSSESFAVVDVSAGPSSFGPIASPMGVVTRSSVPRLQDLLWDMLVEVHELHQVTAREGAVSRALAGHQALYSGQLAGLLISCSQYVFMPDIATERLEYAKRILVPVIVLRDHDEVDPLEPPREGETHGSEFYINLDEVDHAVKQLTEPGQKAVVTSTSYYLHHHPELMAALHKAIQTEDEVHWEDQEQSGVGAVHTQRSSFINGGALLEEFALAADMLTEGLFDHETMYEEEAWEVEHELRHAGTRTLPVFVLSLKHAPENLLFEDRQLYAVSHDAIIVLQLTDPLDAEGYYTGGVYTGHELNGQHLVVDAHNPTRHIVAGLSTAIAGIVPPYMRYDPLHQRFEEDWRWSVGAMPFGPYSWYAGMSMLTSAIAQRNILLAHSEAALLKAVAAQDKLDAFIRQHLQSPFQFIEQDIPRPHYLEVLHEPGKAAAKKGGFNTSLTHDVVLALELRLQTMDEHLGSLLVSLYDHRFQDSHTHVSALHTEVDLLHSRIEEVVDEGMSLLQCCRVRHQPDSVLTYGGLMGAVLAFLLVTAVMLIIILTRAAPKKAGYRRTSRGILG